MSPKTVVELFGHETTDTNHPWKQVVAYQECPFLKRRCYKVRKSESSISIGTCTVTHGSPPVPTVICPTRFVDRGQIFVDCVHLLAAHEPGNELHLIPEVKVPGGNVDFFLVSVKNEKIVDFVGIEIQTLDTTGTVWPERQRVLESLGVSTNDVALSSKKSYNMNWKMTAKTILVQMHHKASTFEHVNRKLVLVVQKEFLDYMQSQFQFGHFSPTPSAADTVQIHAYNLKDPVEGHRGLGLATRISTSADGIGQALGVQAETRIELETILDALQRKMSISTLFSPFVPNAPSGPHTPGAAAST